MGGRNFRTNHDFVTSAVAEVDRLRERGLTGRSRLLDWGCGAGRLAIGLKESPVSVASYHGVDVQKPVIAWARRHLADDTYEFTHVNAANARYNPDGSRLRRIPGDDDSYDVFYANSVFSHLDSEDVDAYLKEVDRLLSPGGFAFFTAFVEDDVEPEMENPPGYGPLKWSGPLHCVRYERGFFEDMIGAAGLTVREFSHGTRSDGQSLYVVGHVTS